MKDEENKGASVSINQTCNWFHKLVMWTLEIVF